ncbi:MAG: histidine--tRNA ligase [Pseudomonadota bacterium]
MSTLARPTGTQDWTGARARELAVVERVLFEVIESYSFEPLRLPMMESVELFKRGVGDATDIVEKEMFVLERRGNADTSDGARGDGEKGDGEKGDGEKGDREALALRPEGTASTVRALQQEALLYNQQQRVYYAGSMFRYERPQKGRYREFYQVGVEAFGFAGPDLDAQLLALAADCWRALEIEGHLNLELNTIGSSADRARYGEALRSYLAPLRGELDQDSQRRLERNPLRILDAKAPRTQELLEAAPKLTDYINAEARAHFDELLRVLDGLGIAVRLNPRLVRGLDYYNNTVLEWTTEDLGAQRAVCAGGRYDGLVELLGGKPMPAAGFAFGLDRIVLLRELAASDNNATPIGGHPADVYLCAPKGVDSLQVELVARRLRSSLPGLKLRVHLGGGKLDKQLKRADSSGAQVALIFGPDEAAADTITVKPLRGNGDEQRVALVDVAQRLEAMLN